MNPSDAEHWQHERYGEQDRRRNRASLAATPEPGLTAPVVAGAGVDATPIEVPAAPAPSTTDIPAPDSGVIWGVDFAGHCDGTPDMQCLKSRGARFVYIKAADGTLKVPFFQQNVANAQAAGLVVGAYFWLYRNVRVPCKLQAKAWWSIVQNLDLDFHVVDFEWTTWRKKPDNPTTSDLRTAIDTFQQLSGEVLWIYSAPDYLSECFKPDDRFKANPLILAQYRAETDSVAPWGPNGHTMHQISDHWPGSELGVDPIWSVREDGDIFNGDESKFQATFPPHIRLPRAVERLDKYVRIHTTPQNIAGNLSDLPQILPEATIRFVKIVDDLQYPGDPNYKWLQLDDTGTQFVNYIYPPAGERFHLLSTLPPG